MAKEAFIDWRPQLRTYPMIRHAEAILAEYQEAGITMTLRGLHYQFVARGLFENSKKNYDKLGATLSQARLAGLIDWDFLEDRVRNLYFVETWPTTGDNVDGAAERHRIDIWATQDYRPEVHIEKDALAGTIESVCNELRVPFFPCRGYVSQSAQYAASKRFQAYLEAGQTPIVFHLGDHDPSGLDMTRENREKIKLLTGEEVEVRRLAINHDQVKKYKPPPNWAKIDDPRAGRYIRRYGKKSWELDALNPKILQAIVRDAIKPLIDPEPWEKAMKIEAAQRKELRRVHTRWPDVVKFSKSKPPKKKAKKKRSRK